MCLPSPSIPTPPPPPEVPKPPTEADPAVQRARREARRRALAGGRSADVKTTPLGLPGSGPTTSKTLLGQ